jgi:hypothetical protein
MDIAPYLVIDALERRSLHLEVIVIGRPGRVSTALPFVDDDAEGLRRL